MTSFARLASAPIVERNKQWRGRRYVGAADAQDPDAETRAAAQLAPAPGTDLHSR